MEEFKVDISRVMLEQAQKTISSTLCKNEKAYETLSQKQNFRPWQLQMVAAHVKDFRLMLRIIKNQEIGAFEREELEGLQQKIPLYIGQIEKVKPKFKAGTSQHTLAVRRIEAYCIVSKGIEVELRSLTENNC